MDDQEQEKSKIGETLKEGAKALFSRLPVSVKLRIIGIVAGVVVVLVLIIIILGSILAPIMEVRDKIVDFFNGNNTSDKFVSLQEYDFYKTVSEVNAKYSQYIDLPLALTTLFYSTEEEQTQDTENPQTCTNVDGEEVSCNSSTGINFWGKAEEYKQLVAQMMDIKQTTYSCNVVDVPGIGGATVYSKGDIIEEKIIDSASKDILSLTNENCDSASPVNAYTFTQNINKYDTYLMDSYIFFHRTRFGYSIFDLIISEDDRNSTITAIHDRTESNRSLFEEGNLGGFGGNYGTIPSDVLSLFKMPIKNPFRISSCFGMRIINGRPDNHPGMDLVAEGDPTIYSIYNGVVTTVKMDKPSTFNCYPSKECGGYLGGNYIIIRHEVNGSVYISKYLHLKQEVLEGISVGATVVTGQAIGIMGNTGYSTNDHLHFSLYNGNTAINPGNLFYGGTGKTCN